MGKEGDGFKIAMRALDGGRVNIGNAILFVDLILQAACSLGASQKCLDLAKDYVKGRKQFGQPLANFQVPYSP